MPPDLRGLLLCGGASTRFGANKLLAPMPDGAGCVAARAARNLIDGAGNALAVVPPGDRALRAALEALGCEVVESDRTARGMGASLAAAVAASDRADGWIVALGDMPLIAPRTIAAVRLALEAGAQIAAPVSADGVRGHPVGFLASLRPGLVALDGDAGARELIARHRSALRALRSDDPGILLDLDTPAQLAALSK